MSAGRGVALAVLAGLAALPALAQEGRRVERQTGAGERRLALVIGNDAYHHVEPLRNAVADAQAVAARLRSLGVEVRAHTNLDRRSMARAAREFVDALPADAVAIFFYAGHGVQVNGANYLLPVDLERVDDVLDEGLELGQFLERVGRAQVAFSLAIVDACRNNPFQGASRTRTVANARGLAAPSAPRGFVVVYSAGANQTALDRLGESDRSPNGLFTRELLPLLGEPGLSITAAVKQAARAVAQKARAVGHEQQPAIYDQSTDDFYLRPAVATASTPAAPDADALACQALANTSNPAVFEAYLKEFPRGSCAGLARVRLAALGPAPASTTPAPPATTPKPRPSPRWSLKRLPPASGWVGHEQMVNRVPISVTFSGGNGSLEKKPGAVAVSFALTSIDWGPDDAPTVTFSLRSGGTGLRYVGRRAGDVITGTIEEDTATRLQLGTFELKRVPVE